MRICTAYGSPIPLRKDSDMDEIRLDVFDRIPDDLDDDSIITLCGKDISCVPDTFGGLVDIGDRMIQSDHRMMRSIHNFNGTPDADTIVKLLSEGGQEISKGAFTVDSFKDLHSIMTASKKIGWKHVLIGMGEFGIVTRIRQELLDNEFTFGFEGTPTALGQLSTDELKGLGDDCILTGIIGRPLSHSSSPSMQNSAMKAAGINGIYLRFEANSLDYVRETMLDYDIRGMNITIPYKQDIIGYLDKISGPAEDVGAVNTIVNDDGVLIGENTDIIGIGRTFEGKDIKGSDILIMGSGGAARSAAYYFTSSGCNVSIAGRNERTVKQLCDDFGAERDADDISAYDIIVNCTPIGIVDGEYPVPIQSISKEQTVFDMVYGHMTPLLSHASEKGCRTIDGKRMLVEQGAASFRLWFDKEPDREIMWKAIP